jgi:ATP-binding cassette subfamily C protein CydD
LSTERRLIEEEQPAGALLALAILTGVTAAAAYILLAYFLSDVVSRVFLEEETLADVLSSLYFMMLLLFIRGCSIWGRELLAHRSATIVKGSLRAQLSNKLIILGPFYTRAERSGELVSTIVEGVESLDSFITQYLTAKALAFLVPILVFLTILYLDPWTTLIFLAAVPMMLLILALIGGRAKAITERRFLEMSWMSAFFLDILQGLTTLKLFGREQEQAGNIKQISDEYGSTTMEVLRTAFQSSLVMEWAATAATAMVALTVSLRLLNGSLPFSVALTVLLLTPEFFLPIRQYALRFHAGTAGKAAADRIYSILDTGPSKADPDKSKLKSPLPQKLDISFENVSFAYEDGKGPALRDFSLRLAQGSRLLIVGPTGAGKTTISQLLLRFTRPDSGRVMVGGVPLDSIDENVWRRQIAWLPQLPHIFLLPALLSLPMPMISSLSCPTATKRLLASMALDLAADSASGSLLPAPFSKIRPS